MVFEKSTVDSLDRYGPVADYSSCAISLTLFSISSLIPRTSSIDLPFGSSRCQSISFFCIAASVGLGHASSTEQPIVTTRRALLIMSAVSILDDFRERSIPRSFIASITTGLTRLEGTVPALAAFSPIFSANAWAIWLRPAFSTQTNKISPFDGVILHSEGGFPAKPTGRSLLKNALRSSFLRNRTIVHNQP